MRNIEHRTSNIEHRSVRDRRGAFQSRKGFTLIELLACHPKPWRRKVRSAFTLIELLVAIVILAAIVVAMSQLFHESTVSWDSGKRRAEMMMTGRAILDFVAREVAMAVYELPGTPDGYEVSSGSSPSFVVLEGTNFPYMVQYQPSGGLKRTVAVQGAAGSDSQDLFKDEPDELEITDFEIDFSPNDDEPEYADIELTVEGSQKGLSVRPKYTFTSRVYLINRHRYLHE